MLRLFLQLLLIVISSYATSEQAKVPEVQLTNGRLLRGIRRRRDDGIVEERYLGIPYAKPPLGADGRWKKPSPLDFQNATLLANEPSAPCWGRVVPGTGSPLKMDEDCLYLDVYRPDLKPGRSLPVLIYLHGGSLVEGSSTSIQSAYMGFADSPVKRFKDSAVIVSVNYRVAVMGFLALKSLDKNGGNFGLYDCIEALRFLRANIHLFGGDRNRMTVFGQSSGGSLVLALSISPLAHAGDGSLLFQRGISMSGSPRMDATWKNVVDEWHPEFLRRTPCGGNKSDAETRRCLQNMSAAALTDAMPPDWDSASFSFSAFAKNFSYAPLLLIDGEALTADYITSFSSPPEGAPLASSDFTLVIGATREEIDFAPGDYVANMSDFAEFVRSHVSEGLGESLGEKVIERYGLGKNRTDDNPQQLYAQIVTDATIWCPTTHLVNAVVNRQRVPATIYVYQTDQRPGNRFCPLGPFQAIEGYCPQFSFHAVDLFFLFAPQWGRPGCCLGDQDVVYTYTPRDISYVVSKDIFVSADAFMACKDGDGSCLLGKVEHTLDDRNSTLDAHPPGLRVDEEMIPTKDALPASSSGEEEDRKDAAVDAIRQICRSAARYNTLIVEHDTTAHQESVTIVPVPMPLKINIIPLDTVDETDEDEADEKEGKFTVGNTEGRSFRLRHFSTSSPGIGPDQLEDIPSPLKDEPCGGGHRKTRSMTIDDIEEALRFSSPSRLSVCGKYRVPRRHGLPLPPNDSPAHNQTRVSSWGHRDRRMPTTTDLDRTVTMNNITLQKKHSIMKSKVVRMSIVSKQPSNKHNALIIDCGSGETKVILMRFDNDAQSHRCPRIQFQIVSEAPAMLDFLGRVDIRSTPGYRKAMYDAERDDLDHKLETHPWYFLKQPPKVVNGDYRLSPELFTRFCNEHAAEFKVDTTFAGASGWQTQAAKTDSKNYRTLTRALANSGLIYKHINPASIVYFETLACAYASKMRGLDNVAGVLGSGGSSANFMHSMREPCVANIGYRDCMVEVIETWRQTHDALTALAVVDSTRHLGPDSKSASAAKSEMLKALSIRGVTKVSGTVICISASYFAAHAVGLHSKRGEMKKHRVGDVKSKFSDRVRALRKECRRKPTHFFASDRLRQYVNLRLQLVLYEALFADDATIIFKRDWALGKHSDSFRTTWTAGWYLCQIFGSHDIGGLGMRCYGPWNPRLCTVLKEFERRKSEADATLARERMRLPSVIGDRAGTAMALVDLEKICQWMRNKAELIGRKIDPFIVHFAKSLGGEMRGYPEYRVKGPGSLRRKLISEVAELLEKNRSDDTYTPDIQECVSAIHDTLRYTICFPCSTYTSAVKTIEKALFEKRIAKRVKFKNFWQNQDLLTTYMGLNAQIECRGFSDIEDSEGFIFELQIHTQGSFNRKNGPGHFLYENFRDPMIRTGFLLGRHYDEDQYKCMLYVCMAILWTRKDKLGNKFCDGDIISTGIPNIDSKSKKPLKGAYPFEEFLPHESICDYEGLFPDRSSPEHDRRTLWVWKVQSSKKYSHILDSLRSQRLVVEIRREKRLADRAVLESSKMPSPDRNQMKRAMIENEGIVDHHRDAHCGEGLICPDCRHEFASIELLHQHSNECHVRSHREYTGNASTPMIEVFRQKTLTPDVPSLNDEDGKDRKKPWRERLKARFLSGGKKRES
eukprot:g204.t1